MDKKQARQLCREKAKENNRPSWPLCWNKQYNYYPSENAFSDNYTIAHVNIDGTYSYVSKENQRKHNLFNK